MPEALSFLSREYAVSCFFDREGMKQLPGFEGWGKQLEYQITSLTPPHCRYSPSRGSCAQVPGIANASEVDSLSAFPTCLLAFVFSSPFSYHPLSSFWNFIAVGLLSLLCTQRFQN